MARQWADAIERKRGLRELRQWACDMAPAFGERSPVGQEKCREIMALCEWLDGEKVEVSKHEAAARKADARDWEKTSAWLDSLKGDAGGTPAPQNKDAGGTPAPQNRLPYPDD